MIDLRHAGLADIDHIDSLLRSLSQDLGDRHRAGIDNLRQAGFGQHPAFHAQIAVRADNDAPMGIALYSPLFSTVHGDAGMYLSDLWVAPEERGTGLGSRLIAAATSDASARWRARFVKLPVYHDNTAALAFYDRLGFVASSSFERYLILKGTALDTLLDKTKTPEKP